MWPFILKIFADAGYQGARAGVAVASTGSWVLETVERTELHKFTVLPKRLARGGAGRFPSNASAPMLNTIFTCANFTGTST